MLCDVRRNAAYRGALRDLLRQAPVRLALDIGAGTGLLSMLAADAGAARVIACEQQPAIAAVGRETVAANGHADRIGFVEKDCRALEIPGDLPERADLALFELFDCSLIGEGVLHFLAHAREHLLRPDARFLPAGARLRAQVVEYRFDRVLGVDAGLLNPYLASLEFVNVDARTLGHRPLSEPFDLFDFDFATAGPAPQELAIDPVATADGTASALLFWFDLRLDGATTLSNAPDAAPLHWRQGLQFLPEARVSAGQALPLAAKHNGSALRIQWRPDGLPQEAFSRLPRLDPNWLAANAELDQRTGQLLQHCAQDPEEYRKVAEIAQRLAVDPARYGLDPVIAERFLRMFLNAPD
jgi:type II protein arginine methyltransferase